MSPSATASLRGFWVRAPAPEGWGVHGSHPSGGPRRTLRGRSVGGLLVDVGDAVVVEVGVLGFEQPAVEDVAAFEERDGQGGGEEGADEDGGFDVYPEQVVTPGIPGDVSLGVGGGVNVQQGPDRFVVPPRARRGQGDLRGRRTRTTAEAAPWPPDPGAGAAAWRSAPMTPG